ncbi:APC family permease [Sphingomonas sp.]|uniref:APC family permease n=1 Tax=Sphingomonas sp. TaxID=28214 RepID=UPI000DAFBFF5|nr:APC family permease [Sphingomonas sp.]PZU11482.1 MAG: amino acid transporter [Sphingomonas sp.]
MEIEPHKLPPVPHGLPGLPRSLGVAGVLFLTLSATTPASSVFVIVPGMLRAAGSGTLIALAIAALVCVATAYVYAELSSAWPIAGGEYVMVARTLGPTTGFVVLGVNVVNNLIFTPVVALGVSDVLARVFPGLPQVPVALALVAVATGVGLLNIRTNALVTGLFLIVELIALAALVWAGLAVPAHDPLALLLHPQMPGASGLVPATPAAIGTATTIAIFALNGYGMAVYFGEDMRDAPRRIGGVVLLALVLVLVTEIVPVAAALIGAPDLGTFLTGEDPFGALVAMRGGRAMGNWVAAGVALAIANAAIVSVLAFARFFYSTARDGVWGGRLDIRLQAIHPRLGSPWIATLVIGAAGLLCCLLPLDLLLVLSGAGLVLTYAAIALAALVGRRTGATAHAVYRMPLFPLAPVLTLAALIYVVWASWWDVEEGRPGLIATGAQVAISILYYRFVICRRGVWTTRDPRN